MRKKKQLGQFYTTNVNYIFQDIYIDDFKNKSFIEPFTGNNDLINWIKEKFDTHIEKYDIFPQDSETIQRNTLLNSPDYTDKVVITNPPYLAKNKAKTECNKMLFTKYKQSDLFRIFINQLIEGNCYGGIIIIPLNFFSSIKKNDTKLRISFLERYNIVKLNIFEEQVFNDTSYVVCAFKFIKKISYSNIQKVDTTFYPTYISKFLIFDKNFDCLIGGQIYKLGQSEKKLFKVGRLIDNDKIGYITTNLFINLIDSGTEDGKIKLQYKENKYVGKISDRVFATIIIKPIVNVEKYTEILKTKNNQIEIAKQFNHILNEYRDTYNSLFLSNYREAKNNNGRKRCSFGLCYGIIRHILLKFLKIN